MPDGVLFQRKRDDSKIEEKKKEIDMWEKWEYYIYI